MASYIRFADLVERETRANDAHVNTVSRLEKVLEKRALSVAEKAGLDLSRAILMEIACGSGQRADRTREVCDPLFVTTRTLLNEQKLIVSQLLSHEDGVLVFNSDDTDSEATLTSLVLGLLIVDAVEPPPVTLVPQLRTETGAIDPEPKPTVKNPPRTVYPDVGHPQAGTFTSEFFRVVGEARGYGSLAGQVLALLAVEGDPGGYDDAAATVRCEEFARVMRLLSEARVGANETQLRRRVNEMLNKVQNVGSEDDIADSSIDLPDLDQIFEQNIVAENVRAMGAMVVSAMFEELKVFQVVDAIVEQFQHGDLPIGPGRGRQAALPVLARGPQPDERAGAPQLRVDHARHPRRRSRRPGQPGVQRPVDPLRLLGVLLRPAERGRRSVCASAMPSPISHQQVRKAARDLASNLSLHGYGMAHYAAREIQSQVKGIITLLGDPEILGCFGAKDMWQVVDQVATYYLGGARTSSRYRTLASCGTIITAWLANNVSRIHRTSGPLIDMEVVRNPPVAGSHKATKNPDDYDLVNACELWLADTATSDSDIEKLALEPRNTPTMTSKPILIPTMAREMLSDLGDIGVGLGHGHGYAPPRASFGLANGHARMS